MSVVGGPHIRAATIDELMAAFHEFGITDLDSIGANGADPVKSVTFNNCDRDPAVDPGYWWNPHPELNLIERREDGWVEIDVGIRYLLAEPLDAEIGPAGFVVWAAAQGKRWFLRKWYEAEPDGLGGYKPETLKPIRHYMRDGELFEEWRAPPLFGILSLDQFPLSEHGWGPDASWRSSEPSKRAHPPSPGESDRSPS